MIATEGANGGSYGLFSLWGYGNMPLTRPRPGSNVRSSPQRAPYVFLRMLQQFHRSEACAFTLGTRDPARMRCT